MKIPVSAKKEKICSLLYTRVCSLAKIGFSKILILAKKVFFPFWQKQGILEKSLVKNSLFSKRHSAESRLSGKNRDFQESYFCQRANRCIKQRTNPFLFDTNRNLQKSPPFAKEATFRFLPFLAELGILIIPYVCQKRKDTSFPFWQK